MLWPLTFLACWLSGLAVLVWFLKKHYFQRLEIDDVREYVESVELVVKADLKKLDDKMRQEFDELKPRLQRVWNKMSVEKGF